MEKNYYRLSGIDSVMELLRPQATYQFNNGELVYWNDPRPAPTKKEIIEAQNAYAVQAGTSIAQMPQVGFGVPQIQYDALYRPSSNYLRRMGVA